MKKTNLLILLGVIVLSLILVSGTLAAASASRNAVLLQNQISDSRVAKDMPFMEGFLPTNMSIDSDEPGVPLFPDSVSIAEPDTPEVPPVATWEKWIEVNDMRFLWEPQWVVGIETSNTIIIEDIIYGEGPLLPFQLIETWNPDELELISYEVNPEGISEGIVEPGRLTWNVTSPPLEPMTLIKEFHVKPCNWLFTDITEELVGLEVDEPIRLVEFQKIQPDLYINADYESEATAGALADFTLIYGNNGGNEISVTVRNDFPDEAPFNSSDPLPDREDPTGAGAWVEWDLPDLPYAYTDTIDVSVDIQAGLPISTQIQVVDIIFDHMRVEADRVTINLHVQDQEPEPIYDLGDAPDSTNHFLVPMTAYPRFGPPGTIANYPTVFDPATGMPQGPRHGGLGPDEVHLGLLVSPEYEADLPPDSDGITNLDVPIDSPDGDSWDDGVQLPVVLPHCVPTTFNYTVNIGAGQPRDYFVNVWFDWNRDGDWEDVFECPQALAFEWAVQNQVLLMLGHGTHVLQTPAFLPFNPGDEPIWMRITLSDQPAPQDNGTPADGRGPAQGYLYGETEDYYLENTNPFVWEKYINDIPWERGIEITVETSDTIKIEDVIHTLEPFQLIETWNHDHLFLKDTFVEPPNGGPADEGPGFVIWEFPPGPPEVVTITKIFHVEESTWSETTLVEELILGEFQFEPRPIGILKRPPDLWIDSFFDVSVYAGDTATFTLDYGNNGGYENNVSIRNEFPETALFLASDPPPDEEDPGGRWVEWDVGDLAMDDMDSIGVEVAIQAGLPSSTTIEIVDYIYNHVGDKVDETIIDFHVEEPPPPKDFDIYIKDNPTDDGSVPSSAPWWTSPDIWVRNDGDCSNTIHQNPVAGVPTTVCVRVRNRMGTPVTNIDVDLYFASAALGLSWPVSWSGIGTINIPVLPPLSEIVEAIPWNTPNITGHFCLLARADALEDPIGSGYDTVAPADLVQNNNNIGMRNLNIVDFPEITVCEELTDTVYADQVPFDIINTIDASVLVDIVFDSADFPLGAGEIVVDPDALWGRWTSLTNFNQVGLSLIATAFPASINGVLMTPYELATLQMSMSAPGNVEFEISVTELKDGHLVGGINYLRMVPTCTYLPLILKAYSPPLSLPGGFGPLQDIYISRTHLAGGLIE